MEHFTVFTERGKDGIIWGSLFHGDDLFVDYAKSPAALQIKFKNLIRFFLPECADKPMLISLKQFEKK